MSVACSRLHTVISAELRALVIAAIGPYLQKFLKALRHAMNGIDPGSWPEVAQKIGLGGAVVLILALGLGIGLATRGPEFVKAFNVFLDTILTHMRESKRINAQIRKDKEQLKIDLDTNIARKAEVKQETQL